MSIINILFNFLTISFTCSSGFVILCLFFYIIPVSYELI